jgi:hypothetical protein
LRQTKSLQNLIRFRIPRFYAAIIGGANQDHGPAVDVSLVAALSKCDFFHAFSNAPFFADFTNDGSFSAAIAHPLAAALTQSA